MSSSLTTSLLAMARDAGASAVGVADAVPFHNSHAALVSRKERGLAGPLHFTFDDPAIATDVSRTFPWARRLLVVGWDYLGLAGSPQPTGALVGRFATKNHYEDLARITDRLAEKLREEGYRAETLIDDNRLVDRAPAVNAGVGWWGKSTMVLTPGSGPWILLGSVATDAPLDVSQPMIRDCGTCVACIDVCPTGALTEGRLDARRCLSTWLQSRGSIPHWIRPRLGRRIYGCDDCLTACPPGKRALASAKGPPLELPFTDLLALSEAELIDRFHWWYVPMRDGRYLLRNVLLAAGNSSEDAATMAIARHIEHRSSMIRGVAAWALARSAGEVALPYLGAALATETAPEAIDEIILAIAAVTRPDTYPDLLSIDEWANTEEAVLAVGVEGLAPEEPGPAEFLVVATGDRLGEVPTLGGPGTVRVVALGAAPDRAEFTGVRLYDPKRILERPGSRRRRAQTVSS